MSHAFFALRAAYMTSPSHGPALIFLHIPKTAGTTLNRIIEWQYDPRRIYTVDPYQIRATVGRLRTLPEARRRRLQVVRGHLIYGVHDCLPQGANYITMLRDPVKRVLSSYQFILRRPLHPLHRKLKAKGIGVEQFLEYTANRQNLQTKMLAGVPYVGPCDEATLQTAIAHAEQDFSVVGLSERFQDSLVMTAAIHGWKIPHYENHKVSKNRPPTDPATVQLIREHNPHDLALYEYGKNRFEQDLLKHGAVMKQAAATLAATPKPGKFQNFLHTSLGTSRFLVSKVASVL